VSANNIRQLSAGAAAYLAENNYVYWRYREERGTNGTVWWYGYETRTSVYGTPEGQRKFDPSDGPLANYVPAGLRPDPSIALSGKTFKPKYQSGYLGIGYNVLLGGGWTGSLSNRTYWSLPKPGEIAVFATSAQVNTFLPPASAKKPMIEEFYGLSDSETTVHFRHAGFAMVGFADGSAGFLPMDKSTLDPRAPQAAIARFAPKGSSKYLLPAAE
jgi:prepilin-type processing-associated H-X9-DG protein